ncbi:helix-turn-helix domain-containing protein [Actinomadura barringtoniae]|uniref:Helix-turn-helix domain-containing protein n=1 Tax=Actinomadura barringtoniae TaxID=1427535 RepID=A0A939P968_9ACTN|nr:helix-turn-helix transcriptional regulator [Actinomadura barringtoniae]MBO2448422.1 helix-turn-helix domain-containing protein [Actinomadura barringtoniae]
MTSVQYEREALGGRLRELRKRSGLTGATLAERLGWPHSKISKLENGRQTPSDSDVRGWCRECGTEGVRELEGLLASLHTLDARYAEWRRLLRGGARGHQDDIAAVNARTRVFLAFEPSLVPGLLQVGSYARAIFAEAIANLGVPNDIDDAVAARMSRQHILYDQSKRFHIIVTEAALRYRLCPPEVMLAQLDRLISATALTNVRLGVIGFRAIYTRVPVHGFWILDDRLVQVETLSAELNLAQPQEIEAYTAAFRRFAAIASYGAQARAILTGLMDELRAELPDEREAATELPS